jgi:hypothetical protein
VAGTVEVENGGQWRITWARNERMRVRPKEGSSRNVDDVPEMQVPEQWRRRKKGHAGSRRGTGAFAVVY